ncbi:MAG: hypothetical protein OXC46_10240 [Thaumarchaeota archaeon]|nr:hypothetical protein [Nitrososphaerota archaeon]
MIQTDTTSQEIILFDTSVLLPLTYHMLELKSANVNFSIQDVLDKINDKKLGIQKKVKAQTLKHFSDKNSKYEEDAKDYLQNFEYIHDGDDSHYNTELYRWYNMMVDNPDSVRSNDWISLKKMQLIKQGYKVPENKSDLKNMKDKQRALSALRDSVSRGSDRQILAQAMKASENLKIIFITNDGDHIVLKDAIEIFTKNQLSVYRPKKIPHINIYKT